MPKLLFAATAILLVLLAASASAAQELKYVLVVHDPPEGALPIIQQLDVWSEDRQARSLTVGATEADRQLLDRLGISYVVVSTVEDLLARYPAPKTAPPGSLDFTDYHDLDSVYAFIDTLEAEHPDIVKQYDLGPAWQGEHVVAMKISDNAGLEEHLEKGVAFIGCHHAREWISVEVPLYIALHIVENYGTDPEITDLVDSLEIWFIPCLNPDGFRYTWDVYRLWRKNRRPPTNGYWGVDLNRNYSVGWGGSGSSGSPNSEVYRGPGPFSEPETQYVKEFVEAHGNILAWITYHSYGQDILYPWGYISQDTPDEATFIAVGTAMKSSIYQTHGEDYSLGQLSGVSGESEDWAYGDHGILGYLIELRPKTSDPGFLLPPEQIIPTCEENLPAALYVAEWVLGRDVYCPDAWLWPGWNWFSIPVVPLDPTPEVFLRFDCDRILWRFDRYAKATIVYHPPFTTFDLAPGEGYLLWLDQVPDGLRARFEGTDPGSGWEEKLGRQGWAWIGKPRMDELTGSEFMQSVQVKYPSDETGSYRTAAQDRASGSPWLNWGWSWWDAELQSPRTFTPYAPFGDRTCIPWRGYRCWVNVGTAANESDPAQVTLIWP